MGLSSHLRSWRTYSNSNSKGIRVAGALAGTLQQAQMEPCRRRHRAKQPDEPSGVTHGYADAPCCRLGRLVGADLDTELPGLPASIRLVKHGLLAGGCKGCLLTDGVSLGASRCSGSTTHSHTVNRK